MRNKDSILLENAYKRVIEGPDSGIKLIALDGTLYTPLNVASNELKNYYSDDEDEVIILASRDETGEPFTVKWPEYDPRDLAIALYDARETGQIPSGTTTVLLPDGVEFEIDAHGI